MRQTYAYDENEIGPIEVGLNLKRGRSQGEWASEGRRSMHLYGAGAQTVAEIVELNVRMICQEGHGNGGIGDSF